MVTTAEENRAYVRKLMYQKYPELARELRLAVSDENWARVIEERQAAENRDGTWSQDVFVVGFGDLDLEHGATGPRLGSDEILL